MSNRAAVALAQFVAPSADIHAASLQISKQAESETPHVEPASSPDQDVLKAPLDNVQVSSILRCVSKKDGKGRLASGHFLHPCSVGSNHGWVSHHQ